MPPVWKPVYAITPRTARLLMTIETCRAEVEHLPLPATVQAELRRQARVRSTHHSTRIEGNRLSLAQAQRAIGEDKAEFHGRERDVREVRNYWNALVRVEEWAEARRPITEDLIRKLHALVEYGPRARPTPYRDGQNVIRDSISGAIIYMPPEAKHVQVLMSGMVRWIHEAERTGVPVPLVAGLAHYQLVTIHPYYDGNGRTARLVATFILHRGGYGLNGFVSVEEYHALDLAGYYSALSVHPHHNYYEGRSEADLTRWVEYFIETLAEAFEAVRKEAGRLSEEGMPVEPELLRRLDRRARVILGLFANANRVAASDVARALSLSDRMARLLLQQWVTEGWITVADPSRRKRSYELSAIYRQYFDGLSAMPGKRHP